MNSFRTCLNSDRISLSGLSRLFVTFILFLGCSVLRSEIIPDDRRIDWGHQVGVPGGVPNRTTIFCNVRVAIPGSSLVAKGDGITDDAPALQAAIKLCPANKVIYMPTGTYLCRSGLPITSSGITLRGDGPGTVLMASCTSSRQGFIEIGLDSNIQGERALTGGYTKGSTNVTVGSSSALAVNQIIEMYCSNPWFVTGGGDDLMRFLAVITQINGNTVTFWPPLAFSIDPAKNPRLAYHLWNVQSIGLENFKIVHANGSCAESVFAYEASWGWIRGVESANTPNRHLYLTKCVNWEISSNYVHEAQAYGPNQGPGIECYARCSGMLIENNILDRCWPSIMLENATVGSVVAYNYSYNMQPGTTFQGGDFNCNHAAHNLMNLWEGNVGTQFQSDGYHGSCSHTTAFRNYFTTLHPKLTDNKKAVDLCRYSYFFNVVGNILGAAGFTGTYQTEANDYSYSYATIYRLGYPNLANNAYNGTNFFTGLPINTAPAVVSELDFSVKSTLLRHGNYDYLNMNTVWDSTISDHTLPLSLYLSGKPAWWNGSQWPPFGPDVPGLTSIIPAQERYQALAGTVTPPIAAAPAAPKNLRILP